MIDILNHTINSKKYKMYVCKVNKTLVWAKLIIRFTSLSTFFNNVSIIGLFDILNYLSRKLRVRNIICSLKIYTKNSYSDQHIHWCLTFDFDKFEISFILSSPLLLFPSYLSVYLTERESDEICESTCITYLHKYIIPYFGQVENDDTRRWDLSSHCASCTPFSIVVSTALCIGYVRHHVRAETYGSVAPVGIILRA